MAGRLEGKVAVITGTGGAGMGRSAALVFAREGAKIVGCDVNAAGAEETVRLVEEAGGSMISLHPCDLLVESKVEELMATAQREFGGIDILYNNATGVRTGGSMDASVDNVRYNLDGTVVMSWMAVKAVVPYMRMRGGGSIINVSSVAGYPVGAGALDNFNMFFAYGVGKAGVTRMTQMLAIDLGEHNIRVNCVTPGLILPNAAPMFGEPGTPLNQAWLNAFLIRRPGNPEDVPKAALYFASEDSSYVTGQEIVVDGGMTVSSYQGSPLQRGFYPQSMLDTVAGLDYAKD